MANIAAQRIKREFKEVIKSEEVRYLYNHGLMDWDQHDFYFNLIFYVTSVKFKILLNHFIIE
jgi:hypothetical protein